MNCLMRRIIITNDAKSKADYGCWPEMFGKNTTVCVSEISKFIYDKSGKEARQTSFLMGAYASARMVMLAEHLFLSPCNVHQENKCEKSVLQEVY